MADANTVKAGSLFNPELVKEMFSKVGGHSSVAKLANQVPVAFSGNEYMTFSLDNEISIVGESGAKPAGGATISPVTVKPLKVVYQARITDEFIKCSEEKQLSYLETFAEGFAKKIARGLDIMVLHGLNPATSSASAAIGTNSFDTCTAVSTVAFSTADYEALITGGVNALASQYDCNGIAISKSYAADLAGITLNGGQRPYEAFMWGGNPGAIRGIACDVNDTVAVSASTAVSNYCYLGDFQNAFKWGYAEQIPLEVIQYGNPDGGALDLKQANEVLLRTEAYVGWGILDGSAFSRIVKA
jgi:HK97 family phage major capsid protein